MARISRIVPFVPSFLQDAHAAEITLPDGATNLTIHFTFLEPRAVPAIVACAISAPSAGVSIPLDATGASDPRVFGYGDGAGHNG